MRRLYTRIYVHFLLVLFVVAAATLAIFALGFRGQFMRGMAERFSRLSSHVLAEVIDDPAKRQSTVRELADVVDADLTVRDLDGNVLASVGRVLPGPPNPRAVDRPRMIRLPRGGRVFVAPVRDRRGALVAVVTARPWRRHGHGPAVSRHAVLLVVALATVGLAVLPLAKRISRPVERLTEATRRFGSGDLAVRIAAEAKPGDELAELQRAWNEMAGRIETLVKGQRELLANVSHELRSPLARIRVALELLPRTAQGAAHLQGVEQDLGELERLIDDVLTASRLEATGLPARPERCSIAAILEQLRERAARDPLLAGKELRVEGDPAFEVIADAGLLKRALWNLVENAAKYGASPIVLSAERSGAVARLSVRDHGAGIPAEERERVFAPFHRLDRARTPDPAGRQGFGLGLTLARRVAEAHRGTIRLEGEPANRFVLELPLDA